MTVKLASGRSPRESDMAKTDPAFHWTLTLPAAAGLLGILDDSWGRHAPNAGAAIHALFAAALCLSVTVPFAQYMRHCPSRNSADIEICARRLSRRVYLVLYVLAGAREMHALWACGAASGSAVAESMRGFQCYLMYGCCALIAIRAMAALFRRTALVPVDASRA